MDLYLDSVLIMNLFLNLELEHGLAAGDDDGADALGPRVVAEPAVTPR